MFTIGSFAGLTGVSAKKLRHYDQIGLFQPAWVDPDTRYRYYLATQIPQLQRILALRDLGLSLPTLVSLVKGGGSLAEALEERREHLLEERRLMERRLAALNIRLDHTEGFDVVVRRRPPGRWASLRARVEPGEDVGALFVEAESVVQEAGVRAPQPPVAVPLVAEGRREVMVLIPVNGPLASGGRVRTLQTPATLVATVLHQGDYPLLFEAGHWAKKWAEATGYTVEGPPWVVYLRFAAETSLDLPPGFLTSQPGDYLTEVQVPVSP
jgi:DNA-binding transcriptional MerR regulator